MEGASAAHPLLLVESYASQLLLSPLRTWDPKGRWCRIPLAPFSAMSWPGNRAILDEIQRCVFPSQLLPKSARSTFIHVGLLATLRETTKKFCNTPRQQTVSIVLVFVKRSASCQFCCCCGGASERRDFGEKRTDIIFSPTREAAR